MKAKKWILLVIAFCILAAGIFAYLEFTRTHKNLEDLKAKYEITATELIAAFEQDEANASAKFIDQVLEVSGTLLSVEKDGNLIDLSIEGGENGGSILCELDSSQQEKAGTLSIGSTIIVRGVCAGFNADELLGSDVILVRAVVVKN